MARIRTVKPHTRVKGLDIVLSNLNRVIRRTENQSLRGLIHAAALIRNETERTPPVTPVDLGNLVASWFVVASRKGLQAGGAAKFEGKKAAELSRMHENSIAAAKAVVHKMPRRTPLVIMGYSANYALFVHEMIGATFQRQGAGPKWLETHFKRNRGNIIREVTRYAKIP